MTTRAQILRLAERNDISFEEAEDLLFDAAELENDRRRDDALFNQNEKLDSNIQSTILIE